MNKNHTTHHDDCGCLTERYKVAVNALYAIHKHQEIVCGGCKGMSTTCYIVNRAVNKLKEMEG